MIPFLDALHSGRVLLMDGAMGTELQRVGLRPGENAASWNVRRPGRVRAIHQAYRAAGARVLLSNTFLANADSFMPGPDVLRPWRTAFELIGPGNVYRLAAIGPVAGGLSTREFDTLGRLLYVPDGRCSDPARHQCCHLPDAILLETCSSPRVGLAIRFLRKRRETPILLSVTYVRDAKGRIVTYSGHRPEWFARQAGTYGIAALGVNCGRDLGMAEVIEVVRRYRQVTDLPLFARPNAGTPVRKGKRWVYALTPEEMAGSLPELLDAGACMVGGCCGTRPAHVAAMRPVVAAWNARRERR